jgi:hypothetical protein
MGVKHLINTAISLGRAPMLSLRRRTSLNSTNLLSFWTIRELLGGILIGNRIDICIDDGLHSRDTILTTMKSVLPHLADDFVYLIEDNRHVHKDIEALYPDLALDRAGELTVVSRRAP